MFYKALWGVVTSLEFPKIKMECSSIQNFPYNIHQKHRRSPTPPAQLSEDTPPILYKAVIKLTF